MGQGSPLFGGGTPPGVDDVEIVGVVGIGGVLPRHDESNAAGTTTTKMFAIRRVHMFISHRVNTWREPANLWRESTHRPQFPFDVGNARVVHRNDLFHPRAGHLISSAEAGVPWGNREDERPLN